MNLFFLFALIAFSFAQDNTVTCDGFSTASSTASLDQNTILVLKNTCTFFIDQDTTIGTMKIDTEFGGKVFVNSGATLTVTKFESGYVIADGNGITRAERLAAVAKYNELKAAYLAEHGSINVYD